MKKSALAVLILVAFAFLAEGQQMKAEDQIKFRKAAYQLMNLNFQSLNAMATDKKPFNKDEAARNAQFVALLSTVPKGFFGEGTDKDTKAKPEIWAHRADFDAKMEKMMGEAAKVPAAVQTGDGAAFKKQMADLAGACKACHDDYRAK
jgi:cytochrome c556